MAAADQTDEALLKAFAGGDRDALATLAGRYEVPLLGLARGLLGGRADLACDAVQEAWVRVIRFAPDFHGRSSVKTWLYRIVINQCRSLRSMRAEPDPLEAPAPPLSPGPEKAAETAERNHRLREAVGRLPAERQTVLLLCYHEGLTHEEVAEVLEIPLGTVKSRLHAALQELRGRLSAEVNAWTRKRRTISNSNSRS